MIGIYPIIICSIIDIAWSSTLIQAINSCLSIFLTSSCVSIIILVTLVYKCFYFLLLYFYKKNNKKSKINFILTF